jgi:hypothetical protein
MNNDEQSYYDKGSWKIEGDLLVLSNISLSEKYRIDGDKITLTNDAKMKFYDCDLLDELEEIIIPAQSDVQ